MTLPKRNKKGRFVKSGGGKKRKKGAGKKRRKTGRAHAGRDSKGRFLKRGRRAAGKKGHAKRAKRRGRRFSKVCLNQLKTNLAYGNKSYAMKTLQECDKEEREFLKQKRLAALAKGRKVRADRAAVKRAAKEAKKAARLAVKAAKSGGRFSKIGIDPDFNPMDIW